MSHQVNWDFRLSYFYLSLYDIAYYILHLHGQFLPLFLGVFFSHFFFNKSKGRLHTTVSYNDYSDILSGGQREYKTLQKLKSTSSSFIYQKNDYAYDEIQQLENCCLLVCFFSSHFQSTHTSKNIHIVINDDMECVILDMTFNNVNS